MSSLIKLSGGVEEVGVAAENTSLARGVASTGISDVLWLSGTGVMIRECRETSKILGVEERETPYF